MAKNYTDYFLYSIDSINIKRPDILPNATDHIPEFIEMIKTLERKGFVYQTNEAVYFDVKKFPDYGKLSGQKLEDKKIAVRENVNIDAGKKIRQISLCGLKLSEDLKIILCDGNLLGASDSPAGT